MSTPREDSKRVSLASRSSLSLRDVLLSRALARSCSLSKGASHLLEAQSHLYSDSRQSLLRSPLLSGPSEAKELSELAALFGDTSDSFDGTTTLPDGISAERGRHHANGLAARAAAAAAASAAAVAMDAAAKASERVVAAAAAHAQRQAMGVDDDVTPRTRADTKALATDLRSALDEASSSIKAAAQAEVAKVRSRRDRAEIAPRSRA